MSTETQNDPDLVLDDLKPVSTCCRCLPWSQPSSYTSGVKLPCLPLYRTRTGRQKEIQKARRLRSSEHRKLTAPGLTAWRALSSFGAALLSASVLTGRFEQAPLRPLRSPALSYTLLFSAERRCSRYATTKDWEVSSEPPPESVPPDSCQPVCGDRALQGRQLLLVPALGGSVAWVCVHH